MKRGAIRRQAARARAGTRRKSRNARRAGMRAGCEHRPVKSGDGERRFWGRQRRWRMPREATLKIMRGMAGGRTGNAFGGFRRGIAKLKPAFGAAQMASRRQSRTDAAEDDRVAQQQADKSAKDGCFFEHHQAGMAANPCLGKCAIVSVPPPASSGAVQA